MPGRIAESGVPGIARLYMTSAFRHSRFKAIALAVRQSMSLVHWAQNSQVERDRNKNIDNDCKRRQRLSTHTQCER
jgi:hypothetical protein